MTSQEASELNKYILLVEDDEWTFSADIWQGIEKLLAEAKIETLDKLDAILEPDDFMNPEVVRGAIKFLRSQLNE